MHSEDTYGVHHKTLKTSESILFLIVCTTLPYEIIVYFGLRRNCDCLLVAKLQKGKNAWKTTRVENSNIY